MLNRFVLLISMLVLVSACDRDTGSVPIVAPEPTPAPPAAVVSLSYKVTVANLTYAQPLSPIAVILHGDDVQGWQLGAQASDLLEMLAEGGDNTDFLTLGLASASGNGAIGPGSAETIEVSVDETSDLELTVATMLVNSNDGFTGITGAKLDGLAVGDSISMSLSAYDAGTEANDELVGTIPGPADGGEGFNEARDDVDFVARHQGVVTQADGYADSILLEAHRFDNPVARLTIERIE